MLSIQWDFTLLNSYFRINYLFFHFLQDEIVAVSEKAVLRVSDLLDWIASPKEIQWDRGLKGVCEADCKPLPEENSEAMEHQYDKGLNEKFSPGHSEFLSDVRQEKETIGKFLLLLLFSFLMIFVVLKFPET